MNSGALARSGDETTIGREGGQEKEKERKEGRSMATADDDDDIKEGRKERMRMQAKDIMHANGNSQRQGQLGQREVAVRRGVRS